MLGVGFADTRTPGNGPRIRGCESSVGCYRRGSRASASTLTLDLKKKMTSQTKALLGCLGGAIVAFFIALAVTYCHCEMYCFWNPSIDTVYAKGFDEARFEQIRIGMTLHEVNASMCEPLGVWTNKDGCIRLWYTSDGKCRFGDFAWLARGVVVSNDQVVAIESGLFYD